MFSFFKVASKLVCGNVQLQNFPGEDPRTPASKGGEGEGRGKEEGKGGEVGRKDRKWEGEEGRGIG